ncbi:MAG: DUF2254 domain-containing protein [Desulfuromonadales bacterium]|nr:DUF2254 domain-containing protein [Desulfuromonadales bacterium]
MRTRLKNFWEKLRTSYWFVPSLMMAGALLLALGINALDEVWTPDWLWESDWAHKNEPEGARELLSTAAGGMITVTGVVFSITIVALSLASQQFGPRLLYNFMRDRGNQFAFGTFLATYLYCLLILRTIRQGSDSYVPHLSILVGFLLVILSLGVLIYFIHHVAESIQAMTVIATVHGDLQRKIEKIFPVPCEESLPWSREASERLMPEDFEGRALAIKAGKSGYLQAVNGEGLMQVARKYDLLIRYENRPGHYLIKDSTIARVLPLGGKESQKWQKSVKEAFIIGKQRTQEQDVEFLIHELVEIAVRALSPGINDPHTAINCIDRLGSTLAELAGRAMPSSCLHDREGNLRLITRPHTWQGLVEASIDQIRQYGLGSVAVTIRLLEMIGAVLPFVRDESRRQALLRQAAMIERGSQQAFSEESDCEDIRRRYLAIFDVLEQTAGITGGK